MQNVIAPQGTAFTEKQARMLKRYVEEVVLCFDADAAGEKAAERSLPHLLAENLLVRVAEMPPGEDPDSMIRGKGAGAFTERIAAAKDFFDFQIDRLAAPAGLRDAARQDAGGAQDGGVDQPDQDAVLREAVMHKVTQRLEISRAGICAAAQSARPRSGADADETRADDGGADRCSTRPSGCSRWWRCATPPRASGCWTSRGTACSADDPDAALLVKILGADLASGRPGVDPRLPHHPRRRRRVRRLRVCSTTKPPAHPMAIAHDCWRELERRQIRRRMETLQARLRAPNLALDEAAKLQKEILDLQKRLSDIARPLSPPL